jgi:hypothetical protein
MFHGISRYCSAGAPPEEPQTGALVERALPLGDDERRNPVADQVRRRERLRYQAVDSEDERDALDRDRSDGGKRRGEHDKGGAGDAGRSFCCEQQHRQQPERPGRHPAGITAGIGSVSRNGSEGPKGGPLWRRRLSE